MSKSTRASEFLSTRPDVDIGTLFLTAEITNSILVVKDGGEEAALPQNSGRVVSLSSFPLSSLGDERSVIFTSAAVKELLKK